MGSRKRGILLLLGLIFLILFSFNALSTQTTLNCNCNLKRDNNVIQTISGSDVCSLTCYEPDGRLKSLCREIGTYTIDLICNNGESSYTCPSGAVTCSQSGTTAYDNLLNYEYPVVSPGCTLNGNEICFNGIDDDCDGNDYNQSDNRYDSLTYCPCNNSSNLGLINPLTGYTDICVYDTSKRYDWKVADNDYFKIYSIKNSSGKEMDVVSNSKNWSICGDASDFSITQDAYDIARCINNACPLSGQIIYNCNSQDPIPYCKVKTFNSVSYNSNILSIPFYGTFNNLSITKSIYGDSDGDGCSDANEINEGTDPNDASDCVNSDTNYFTDSLTYNPYNSETDEEVSCVSLSSCSTLITTPITSQETTQNMNNEPTNFIPLQDTIFHDISNSFMCYEDYNINKIVECCSFTNCFNTDSINIQNPRAVGNSQSLGTIKNFDKYENFVIQNYQKRLSNTNIKLPINASFKSNTILEFDIAIFSMNANPEIILKFIPNHAGNTPVIYNILNLTTFGLDISTGMYRHIIIPNSNIPTWTIKEIIIQITNADILLDNIQLNKINNSYYCSEYFGQWIKGLDPQPNTPINDMSNYEWACKGALSFDWTGTKCCGNGMNNSYMSYDHYVDTKKACFRGIAVENKKTVKEATNLDKYTDLLYVNNSIENKFYACDFNTTGLKGEYVWLNTNINNLIVHKEKCGVFPNVPYFCDYGNFWNNETTLSYTGAETFQPYNRSEYKTITTDFLNITPDIKPASCCPAGFCFDGVKCVDGRLGIVDVVPKEKVYLSSEQCTEYYTTSNKIFTGNYSDCITDDKITALELIGAASGIICSQGNWVRSEIKESPHGDYSGFCWYNNQCYYEDNRGNEKCYNTSEMVTLDNGMLDYYCDNGNWSSRTKLLANELYSKAKEYTGKPFTIFCNNPSTINELLNSPYYGGTTLNQEKNFHKFASYSYEQDNIKYTSCVLTVDNDNNAVFGNKGDAVFIGTPLLNKWNDTSYFISKNACSLTGSNDYKSCTMGSSGTIYYNNKTNTIIYTQGIGKTTNTNFIIKFFNWIISFIKNILNINEVTKTELVNENIPNFERYITSKFKFKNYLYNNLYYYNSGNDLKQIKGILEFKKYGSSGRYLIYTNYVGFNLNFCKPETINVNGVSQTIYHTPVTLTQGLSSEIDCNEKNTLVTEILNPSDVNSVNNYWKDLTAKTRAKSSPVNTNTPEEQPILINEISEITIPLTFHTLTLGTPESYTPSGTNEITDLCTTKIPLDCSENTLASSWYKAEGRCGERGGLNHWNNELVSKVSSSDINTVHTSFLQAYDQDCSDIGATSRQDCHNKMLCNPGDTYLANESFCIDSSNHFYNTLIPLDCDDNTLASTWYKNEGRCGERAGLNYWINDLISKVSSSDITTVHTSFLQAYNGHCSDIGATSRQDCHNKLLCLSEFVYQTNTNYCTSSSFSGNCI